MTQSLTPKEIVGQLDQYIVGQKEAKKAVALAIRNRWRRLQLDQDLQKDIVPKNIIMIGPTGVGKTEIARRIAQLIKAPFIKVEASKYTEVGYHGRDVESMVRDLVKVAQDQVQKEFAESHEQKAQALAEEKIIDILVPPTNDGDEELNKSLREKFREKLKRGELDDKEVEIKIDAQQTNQPMFASIGNMEEMNFDFQEIFNKFSPNQQETKRLPIKDAIKALTKDCTKQFINNDDVNKEALYRVENSGIIFIDEIDKIAGKNDTSNPDVSRGGVQRDLLPIVEGSAINTKLGAVKTDHILFIAAGAFHVSKPSDLMPELQGRFPIRVELESLLKEDYISILTEPNNSLTKQYCELLGTEGVKLEFTEDGISQIAEATCQLNSKLQNIGARRLHTVLEKVLQEINYHASEKSGETFVVNAEQVNSSLKDIIKSEDLSKYIL